MKDKIRIVIKLQKGADLDKAMASIVKKFVENKVEIYAAKPEERGLEYIFNQYEEGRSDSLG